MNDTSAQETWQKVMALYFCAQMWDFEILWMEGLDILAQEMG